MWQSLVGVLSFCLAPRAKSLRSAIQNNELVDVKFRCRRTAQRLFKLVVVRSRSVSVLLGQRLRGLVFNNTSKTAASAFATGRLRPPKHKFS